MDETIWKAWIDFTDEVLHGAEDASKQFETISGGPLDPESALKWFSQWVPGADLGAAGERTQELDEVMETWWRTMGIVPRSIHDTVLKQNAALAKRVESLETKIKELRELLAKELTAKGREEAQANLDQWEASTKDALDAQADFARKWTESVFGVANDGPSDDPDTGRKPK